MSTAQWVEWAAHLGCDPVWRTWTRDEVVSECARALRRAHPDKTGGPRLRDPGEILALRERALAWLGTDVAEPMDVD